MTREAEAERCRGLEGQAVLLAAGLADLAVSTVSSAVGTVRGLLRRSDAVELAADAEHELVARGRLALDRYAAVPPAHLEILARHAQARRAAGGV
ncbi:polyprenyl synthetase [Streptomyces sp. NPDC050546]|uniref:polyprenyl synthetase n=1 Tax=Streptomyces sp. NPDC050546 TaxID=3365628 RepID=UPI00378E7DDC